MDLDTDSSASVFVAASPHLRVSVSSSGLPVPASPHLRVSVSSSSRAMPLEDYILGVVAAEGSTENEIAALKALAVASRTYALKNLRRHANEGYDFCSTTHCQRYFLIDPIASGSRISSLISKAVRESAGEVLQERDGSIVDSYFSASCGGATANIGTLWGVRAPSYLAGGTDEYCLTMPHHTWTDVISSKDLLKALNSDPRTDIGGRLVSALVAKRDAGGRAELITIEGARRRTVSGWDFKIIVGRALGWNLLKSSRFEISRSGSAYVFRGSGFGHGLGLCQAGAHVMARRGASYQQILAKYFPGTRVGTELTRIESHKLKGFSGQKGWFTPACLAMGVGGGKPPFLTCEFTQPERFSEGWRHRRNRLSLDGRLQTGPEVTGVRPLRLEYLAGQEGWFTPACLAMEAGRGKPPFLTCEFTQPERFSKSALRQRRNHRPVSLSPRPRVSLSPRPSVTSHHAVFPSPNLPISASPRLRVFPSPRLPFSPSPRLRVSSRRRTLASEHFRVSYPANVDEREAEHLLRLSESSRTDLLRRVSAAGVSVQVPTLELFINETTGDFVGRTGQPPWAAAATRGNRVELQPFKLLNRRRILETTLRHELVHAMIEVLGHGRTPRWLAEGLALHVSGEGPMISRYQRQPEISMDELEQRLSRPASAEAMRADYAAAFREVKRLIDAEGESGVWRRVVAHR